MIALDILFDITFILFYFKVYHHAFLLLHAGAAVSIDEDISFSDLEEEEEEEEDVGSSKGEVL